MPIEIWNSPPDQDVFEEFKLKRLRHTDYDFTEKEIRLLRKYGKRLQSLMDGTISPCSKRQAHFLKVCKGKADPNNAKERAWLSYQSTLRKEKELDKLYREELQHSPKRDEHLKSRWS